MNGSYRNGSTFFATVDKCGLPSCPHRGSVSGGTTHGSMCRAPGPAVQRLLDGLRLHQAFRQLHRCGPRPVGMFVAELLDRLHADPLTIDLVLTWRRGLDPEVIAAIAGEFPRRPLDLVEAAQ